MLSLRRIGGRMVIAAAVAAVAILVFRDQGGDRGPVRWTIDPRPLGAEVRAIDVTLAEGDRVLACGAFTSAGGFSRKRPAAYDMVTGDVTGWDPNANGTVRALLAACCPWPTRRRP